MEYVEAIEDDWNIEHGQLNVVLNYFFCLKIKKILFTLSMEKWKGERKWKRKVEENNECSQKSFLLQLLIVVVELCSDKQKHVLVREKESIFS